MQPPNQAMQVNLPLILLISAVAALGGFLFGYDSGVINGVVKALQLTFHTSHVVSGFKVASLLLGCAVGAFFAGPIADRFGRRPALFAAAILFAVSSWVTGIATDLVVFIIWRIIGGFAVGAVSIISPAYISEIAPAEIRGRLASLQQMAIVLGLFVAFLVNYLFASASGGASQPFWLGFETWRWMLWAEIVPSMAFLVALVFIPESPRFLVAANRKSQAEAILARISHPKDAVAKVAEIQATLAQNRRPRMSDLQDPDGGGVRPIVWAGIALAALQQLVGINVVFYYGEVLWHAAGFSESDALMINVIGGVINVASTLVAIALVDRWGRKPLLLTGSIGMAFFLGVLAVVFASAKLGAHGNLELSEAAGLSALVAANAYIVCFGMSWGPVMWVMLGEMFPNQIRGAALSVAGLSQWLTNFAVTMTFPVLLKSIGLGGAYGLYAAFAVASFFIVRAIIQETKGRTLEEMG